MKNKALKVLEYVWPSIFVLAIFMIIFAIKACIPFGENNVTLIDFTIGGVPFMQQLWDFLHGSANAFVDWNLGGGSNMYASMIINGFINPISWLIAIFPRDLIQVGLFLVMLIRLMLMATTFFICFKKLFKNLNSWIITLFAVLWTFSSWTLVHNSNFGWFDIMIVLPLLVLATKNVIDNKKIFWFVVVLSYMLINSYYISYMVLVALTIAGVIYVCVCAKQKKQLTANLFYGVIISLLISAVTFIPSCFSSLQGHRFVDSSITDAPMFFSKAVMYMFYSLPIYLVFKLIKYIKFDRENIWAILSTILVCSIGLIIEPINKMWHTGSYFSYPHRYYFLIFFMILFAGAYYLNKFYKNPEYNVQKTIKSKYGFYDYVAIIISLIMFAFGAWYALNLENPFKSISFAGFIFVLIFFVSGVVLIFESSKLNKKWIKNSIIVGICLVQLFTFGINFLGSSNIDLEQKNLSYVNTSVLDNNFRLKDENNLYMENSPLSLKFPSTSTWIHISSENQYMAHTALGYTAVSTSLSSGGGTVLSDMLMQNKYVISKLNLSDKLFNKLEDIKYFEEIDGKTNEILVGLYEYKISLPNVILTNWDMKLDDSTDILKTTNQIYKSMFNKSADVLSSINVSPTSVVDFDDYDDKDINQKNKFDNAKVYKFEIPVEALSNLYLKATNYNEMISLTIDGVNVRFGNNLNLIGTYQNKTANIEIISKSDKFEFYNLDTNKVIELCGELQNTSSSIITKENKLEVTFNNSGNYAYAFVPYTYLNDYKVNNKISNTTKVCETALINYVKLDAINGNNSFEIVFTPQFFNIGLIITIVAVIIFIGLTILNKYKHIIENKFIINFGFGGGLIIAGVVAFLVYFKPLLSLFGS